MNDGDIIIKTKLDDSELKAGLAALGSVIKSGATVVAAAVAAATAAIVTFGVETETSMAKASTLFGDTAVNMEGLNDKTLELSNSTGIAAAQIGESLYSALSAGIPVTEDMGEAMGFLDKNARLATAGFTDVDTAVTATAKVLNAYGMDVSETDRVHKILMQTQNKGITTVGELGQVLAQVTPTASAMGVSFENVGAALASMTAAGTPTAQATTQLNSLIAELGKNGTQAANNLTAAAEGTEYAGMSFKDMMEAGVPLNEVLDMMGEYAADNNVQLLDMFSSIEAGRAALALAGENSEKFTSNLEAMGTSADVVGDAYEKMSGTLEFKFGQMKESAKNLGVAFYQSISGDLGSAADAGIGAVNKLTKTMSSPAFKRAAQDIGKSFVEVGKAIIDIGKPIASVFGKALLTVSKNMKEFAIVAAAAVVAMKGWKAGIVITETLTKMRTALVAARIATMNKVAADALGTASSLTFAGALTKLNLAMAANPVGAAIVGITAFVAVVGIASAAIDKETEAERKLREEQEAAQKVLDEHAEAVRNRAEALASEQESIDKSISATIFERQETQSLWSELQRLCDANGQVIAGNETRANYITSTLSDALGIEISMTDGVIDNYGELCEQMDLYIAKKEAEALLEANSSKYATAKQELKNATIEQLQAESDYNEALDTQETAYLQLQSAISTYNQELAKCSGPEDAHNSAVKTAEDNMKAAQTAYDEATDAVEAQSDTFDTSKATLDEYNQTIAEHDTLLMGLASGSMEELQSAITAVETGYVGLADMTSTELKKTAEEANADFDLIASAYISGNENVQIGLVNQAAESSAKILAQMDKSGELASQGMSGISASMIAGFVAADLNGSLSAEAQTGLQGLITEINKMEPENREAMANAVAPMLEELEAANPELAAEAEANADSFLNQLRGSLGIHSPSTEVRAIFSQVWPGAAQGLQEGQSGVISSASGFVDTFLGKLKSSTNTTASKEAGTNMGLSFVAGIAATNVTASAAGSTLATDADSGAAGVSTDKTGTTFATTFVKAIQRCNRIAGDYGKMMADSANAGIAKVNTSQAGRNFANGFANGIYSCMQNAVNAATRMAQASLQAINRTLDIHSPSRATGKAGRYTVEGFVGSLKDGVRLVKSASEKLGQAVLDGFDVSGAMQALQSSAAAANANLGASLTATVAQQAEVNAHDETESKEAFADMLAGKIVDAIIAAGVKVECDSWEFGKLVRGAVTA